MGARNEDLPSSSLVRHSSSFQIVCILFRFNTFYLPNLNLSYSNFSVLFNLQLFRRLCSEGMDDTVEDKILLMADHYRKLNQYYINVEKPSAPTGKVKVVS